MADYYNAYHATWRNRYEHHLKMTDEHEVKPQRPNKLDLAAQVIEKNL